MRKTTTSLAPFLQLGSVSTRNDNISTGTQVAPSLARPLGFPAALSWLGQSLQPSGMFIGRLIY
jgi:hypothetical protein